MTNLRDRAKDTFGDLDVDDVIAIARFLPRIVAWFRTLGHDPRRIEAALSRAEAELARAESDAMRRIAERFPKDGE